MSDVERLSRACADLLEQGRDLVLKLDEGQYAAPLHGIAASVGAHLRHCLDAFDCLLDGLGRGEVDYDRRARDLRTETDPLRALERIETLRAELLERIATETDRPLRIRADELDLAPGAGFVPSTLSRELRALASHVVHHHALVAVVLRLRGVSVPARFGVAPSTPGRSVRVGV
jgi:uncharacterized damage-inducible protein DinB